MTLVFSAVGQLRQVRHVPDQSAPDVQGLHQLADTALQLSEIDLAGHQLGAAGGEYGPALTLQALGKQLDQHALADPGIAADQHRSRRSLVDGGFGGVQVFAPSIGRHEQGIGRVRVPQQTDGLEEVPINPRIGPTFLDREQVGSEGV